MEVYKISILSFFISMILSIIGIPFLLNMLKDNNCLCINYKNEEIPSSMGLLFIIVQTITLSLMNLFIAEDLRHYVLIYLVAFILIGLVGLLDDLVGDKNVKGFKGHIKSLLKGKLTTGGLKASVGFLVALIISLYISNSIIETIINTLLISLFTNLINLFDLRPGRASKVFILVSIILLITSWYNDLSILLFSFFGILFRYLPIDLKANAMMGDIGSNSLGITLGAYCAITHDLKIKIIYLVVLIVVQMLSEFVSFSKIIEKNKFLRYIDNLGR